jgi:hypothetical protein
MGGHGHGVRQAGAAPVAAGRFGAERGSVVTATAIARRADR